jgi:chaperonin cofactor prefoldin
MMQSFIQSCLTRSVFLGAIVESTLVGFHGVDGAAIAAHRESAAQPKNADALEVINSDRWTFKSLKKLAERYGCVVNASGMYFQPSDTLSRYEMAAAVNECLDQIADRFETTEDRVAAQTLFNEFKKEVEVLRERKKRLEDRTATLESQQFSPTTKSTAEPIIYSQFPGLQPTHWSFQAAQSLSQRYDCVPYAPKVFSGKGGAISRYEMAIFLNACFNQIGHRFANQKDLEMAQALQKEFKPELTALTDRVDFLENRAAMLEPQQFSPTTRLQGQAIITIQGGGFR